MTNKIEMQARVRVDGYHSLRAAGGGVDAIHHQGKNPDNEVGS